jgi:hypothetical protein
MWMVILLTPEHINTLLSNFGPVQQTSVLLGWFLVHWFRKAHIWSLIVFEKEQERRKLM